MGLFLKKAIGFFPIFLVYQLSAEFNFNGGSVTGSKISGEINASGTTFNNSSISGSGNFTNCTFNGCTFNASELPKQNPQEAAKSQPEASQTQKTNPPTATASTPSPTQTKENSSPVGNTPAPSTTVSHPHTQSTNVTIGPRSGVPMVAPAEAKDVSVQTSTNPNVKTHSAFVTRPDADKYRTPTSEKFREQNYKNQLGVKDYIKSTNPYASTEKINPADLDNVSNLPKRAPRPGIPEPKESYQADWEMGMLQQKPDGTLIDKWGNRVGISMYDKKYRDASPDKHTGNHFIYFDQDYVVGGVVIVPKGYYKNLNSGYIFDSEGTKVGEMMSSGEIRWPEFKVDIDPERFSKAYANQDHL